MAESPLSQGSIVWAEVADPRGQAPKKRPLVILTHSDEILLDGEIVAAAITTTYAHPVPANYVELPWMSPRHPVTGLGRRSAVVCNWLVKLRPGDVVEIKGRLPRRPLLEVIEKVRALNQRPGSPQSDRGDDTPRCDEPR
jgi:hypothetical protein